MIPWSTGAAAIASPPEVAAVAMPALDAFARPVLLLAAPWLASPPGRLTKVLLVARRCLAAWEVCDGTRLNPGSERTVAVKDGRLTLPAELRMR
mmetsp:Transcript_103498/g.205718  ORF Transcript_103498/g.205718 Transcript_103498/m.205718 type:complete len:94 (-) Transcript_103498:96-377(-)